MHVQFSSGTLDQAQLYHIQGTAVADLGIFKGVFRFRKISIAVIPLSYSPAGVVNSAQWPIAT